LEALLRRADASEHVATRNAGEKVRTAVEDLRQRVKNEAAEKQVRDRIAALEKEMAAAQEQLREIRPSKATGRRPATTDGPTPKEIRAWAAEQGIECPTRGRVPNTVTDAYRDAHEPAGA
jgi:hypothetical protein